MEKKKTTDEIRNWFLLGIEAAPPPSFEIGRKKKEGGSKQESLSLLELGPTSRAHNLALYIKGSSWVPDSVRNVY